MDEIGETEKILSDKERVTLVDALKAICNKLYWKTSKDIVHLKKLRIMKHLPVILADYEQII